MTMCENIAPPDVRHRAWGKKTPTKPQERTRIEILRTWWKENNKPTLRVPIPKQNWKKMSQLGHICCVALLVTCATYAIDIDCTQSYMAVHFNENYHGTKIWPVNFVGDENCSLVNASTVNYFATRHPDWRGQGGVYEHFPTEGGTKNVSCADQASFWQIDGYDFWARQFVVQNHPLVISDKDEIITVQCTMSSSTENITSTIAARSLSDRQIMQAPVRKVVDHFLISVRSNTTQPLKPTATLTVGSTLKIMFSITSRSHFTSLIVESCEAFERANKVGGSLRFATRGCATPPMGVKMATSSDRMMAILTFKVFRFKTTNQIHLQCTVRGCTKDTASFCVENCTAEGRQKRESPAVRNVQMFEKTLTVDNYIARDDTQDHLEEKFIIGNTEPCSCDLQTCLGNSHNPAVFGVVLAVLVAVPLLPVVVVVIVAVTKRRRGKYYAATQ
ncbi:uncharacterized protein LOC112556393 [Pomacea canaliculata]|uniref:uncharacterized protein LOC112556393 n=1 Tax=Pomacea canaliculata TaxID=400727 RepID=UPI000D72B0B8|nr:uncharacterized protein LOC112556393 [Pomacea canaliculata]